MVLLFRRRLVPVPTLWGGLALLVLAAVLAVALGRAAGPWLAVTAPARAADGAPSKVLIVEGWLGRAELEAAAEYARTHGVRRVIASGGPDDDSFSPFPSYAERAATVMRPLLPGVPVDAVVSPTTASDRTYVSALQVRAWMEERQLPRDAIDVYSRGVHARRTRWLYEMAFGRSTAVGVIAGAPRDQDEARWWTSSRAARAVMGEALALAWTACCFWPSSSPPFDGALPTRDPAGEARAAPTASGAPPGAPEKR